MKSHIVAALSIFLLIFGISLFTINSKNLTDYNLQHMIMEAVVERRVVKLGGSLSPHLQPNGDILTYHGNVYPIKQPGTGFFGALTYFPLYKIGTLYSSNYLNVSSWVSIWLGSAVAGLIGLTLYGLSSAIGMKPLEKIFISLGAVLTTTLLPYSGFPHHDLIALLPIYLALYLVIQGLTRSPNQIHHDYFYLAGFLASFALFFSILPITLILALALIVLIKGDILKVIQFAIGGIIGLIPSLTYNYFVLGGFLHFPNLMGASDDTLPLLSLSIMIPRLLRYFSQPALSIFLFSPLAILGFFGFFHV